MKIQTLKERLQNLHLTAMKGIIDETLKKAATDNLSAAAVLTILAEHEIALRKQKLIKTRIAQAAFPTLKTIDTFDFNFPKNIVSGAIQSFQAKSESLA